VLIALYAFAVLPLVQDVLLDSRPHWVQEALYWGYFYLIGIFVWALPLVFAAGLLLLQNFDLIGIDTGLPWRRAEQPHKMSRINRCLTENADQARLGKATRRRSLRCVAAPPSESPLDSSRRNVSLAQRNRDWLNLNHDFILVVSNNAGRMTIALTFPGQGSQAVGMGLSLAQNFPAARDVFAEVDESLGEHLSKTIWEGPEATLTLTANAQPALMAVSLATYRALAQEYGEDALKPAFLAGHSLGEYSALAAAGVFGVAQAAKLLRLRGQAMQEAVPPGEGAMLALLGAEVEQAENLAAAAAQGDVSQVANDNAPGQVVISGAKSAMDRAIKIAPEHGVRRAVPLPVSAPFHCALMKPAADRMAEALAVLTLNAPSAPIVANVRAAPVTDPQEIKSLLVEQVTGVVRWRESVAYMVDNGVETLFEIGAGKVLTGLAKRIRAQVDARAIGTPDDIKAFGEWLKTRSKA
jgi:[acyl-carrier-protein] S-malonyltransferase